MNKFVTMIAAAASLTVAAVALSAKANAGAVLDNVLATKTLKVAVGADWGPLSHLDDSHELVGYDVDVAKAVAEHLGAQIQFVTPGWDIITGGKWQGRWDLAMGAMVPTKARAEALDFPAIYFWGPNSAIVHKDSKATTPSDLEGKVVGVAGDTSAEAYANHDLKPDWQNASPVQYQFKAGQVKIYGTTKIAFDDLRLGDGVRLDAVIVDTTFARDSIKAGYPLKILEPPLFSAPGAISVLPGDKEFGDKIAAAIKKMKDDGTLSKLSTKWYDADYSKEQ
ncbi:transporter substrate-binding domain-containing protein [Mesorhizobium sp.]|uniref:transporter substrate-binding domain-containing protein n=1 Tax=Mesorhizobium sp. TaxID=1871066 RepID=UPI000FE73169|nr:transporter substrate-binding domain-containing protein [Mesorhizobium sp.]RWP55530.1 MAG: transporter substrate-binding domain-containing protein [Mesorhizobium sp.]